MFGEKYNEMRLATYKSSSGSPLLMAEEFMPPPAVMKQKRTHDYEHLVRLAVENNWTSDIELKQIMKPFMAVIVTDIHKRIIWVSGYFKTMTGYSIDEVVNKNPKFLQGSSTNAITLNTLRKKIGEQKKFKGVLMNYKKNGEPYECNVEISPIFDAQGKHVHYIAFETDRITPNA